MSWESSAPEQPLLDKLAGVFLAVLAAVKDDEIQVALDLLIEALAILDAEAPECEHAWMEAIAKTAFSADSTFYECGCGAEQTITVLDDDGLVGLEIVPPEDEATP